MLWHERISFLTSHNKFVPALELAMSFYEDNALAVAGMPKQRADRKKLTRAKLIELLQSYVLELRVSVMLHCCVLPFLRRSVCTRVDPGVGVCHSTRGHRVLDGPAGVEWISAMCSSSVDGACWQKGKKTTTSMIPVHQRSSYRSQWIPAR